MSTPEEAQARRALFRVVSGEPTDEELAALTVVLAAAAGAGEPAAETAPAGRWNDRAADLRAPLSVGPDAWRTSTWPR